MLVSAINANNNQLKTPKANSKNDFSKKNSLNNSPSFQHVPNWHDPADVIGAFFALCIIGWAIYNRRKKK